MRSLCLAGAAMLLGVVLVDLKFDLHPEQQFTHQYYLGHESASVHGQTFVPAIIAVFALGLISQIVNRPSPQNLMCVGLSAAILYLFTQILVPIYQTQLSPGMSQHQQELLAIIKQVHLIIAPMVILIIILQAIQERPSK